MSILLFQTFAEAKRFQLSKSFKVWKSFYVKFQIPNLLFLFLRAILYALS
jgi:hypothetical protein